MHLLSNAHTEGMFLLIYLQAGTEVEKIIIKSPLTHVLQLQVAPFASCLWHLPSNSFILAG